jgi:hypothetical protein
LFSLLFPGVLGGIIVIHCSENRPNRPGSDRRVFSRNLEEFVVRESNGGFVFRSDFSGAASNKSDRVSDEKTEGFGRNRAIEIREPFFRNIPEYSEKFSLLSFRTPFEVFRENTWNLEKTCKWISVFLHRLFLWHACCTCQQHRPEFSAKFVFRFPVFFKRLRFPFEIRIQKFGRLAISPGQLSGLFGNNSEYSLLSFPLFFDG